MDRSRMTDIETAEPDITETIETKTLPTTRKKSWFRKYIWQGQALERSHAEALNLVSQSDLASLPWLRRQLILHRRLIGFAIPASIFHLFWWAGMIKLNAWHLFAEKYYMSLTMIFGSLVSGMTSEGGGAVAFPVMTLAFSILPSVARDFSVMIQSCGMSAASFTILFMRIRCEWRALAFSSLGGLIGLILGQEIIDDLFTPKEKKLGFVSIWFAFASVLLFQIVFRRGKIYNSIQGFNWWKALVLVCTGCVGGIFNGVVGNGSDICTFSVLTLLFRVSEKIATPTSVLLMALNSVVAVYWRGVMLAAITQEAWEFLAVCIPIVVIGAPIGSILRSHLHRIVLSGLVIVLDTLALIGAYVILPMSLTMGMVLGGIIVGSVGFFGGVAYVGYRLQNKLENKIPNCNNMVVEEHGSSQTDKNDGNSNDPLVEMEDLESRDSNGPRAETHNGMVTRDSDGHPIRMSDIGSRDHENSSEPMKRHVPLAQRLINSSST